MRIYIHLTGRDSGTGSVSRDRSDPARFADEDAFKRQLVRSAEGSGYTACPSDEPDVLCYINGKSATANVSDPVEKFNKDGYFVFRLR